MNHLLLATLNPLLLVFCIPIKMFHKLYYTNIRSPKPTAFHLHVLNLSAHSSNDIFWLVSMLICLIEFLLLTKLCIGTVIVFLEALSNFTLILPPCTYIAMWQAQVL